MTISIQTKHFKMYISHWFYTKHLPPKREMNCFPKTLRRRFSNEVTGKGRRMNDYTDRIELQVLKPLAWSKKVQTAL